MTLGPRILREENLPVINLLVCIVFRILEATRRSPKAALTSNDGHAHGRKHYPVGMPIRRNGSKAARCGISRFLCSVFRNANLSACYEAGRRAPSRQGAGSTSGLCGPVRAALFMAFDMVRLQQHDGFRNDAASTANAEDSRDRNLDHWNVVFLHSKGRAVVCHPPGWRGPGGDVSAFMGGILSQ